jgi:hypothetical protein
MAEAYDVGDLVRIATDPVFSVGGTPTDPTAVSLQVRTPAGVVTEYTYALGQVTKAATGSYYADVSVTAPGLWYWRWEGTGAATAAAEGYIVVKGTVFP